MAETEKITINMNVVDLGKVDLLVEQGFYSNRTDFIKTSIRTQLLNHADIVDKIIVEKSYTLGVTHFTKEYLENLHNEHKSLDVKVVGLLIIADDVDTTLAANTINSLKIMGVFKANDKIKSLFKK